MTREVDQAEKILIEEILKVMPQDKTKITTSQISKSAGIYRTHGQGGLNDAIAQGILNKMFELDLVEKVPSTHGHKDGGWKLK